MKYTNVTNFIGDLLAKRAWDIDITIVMFLAITVMVFYMHFKRYLPTRLNRTFFGFAHMLCITLFCDIAMTLVFTFSDVIPIWICYLVGILRYIAASSLMVVYLRYIFMLTGREKNLVGRRWLLFSTPTNIMAILAVTTPLTKLIFSFDKNRNVVIGVCNTHDTARYLVVVMTIIGLVVVIKYRRNLEKKVLFITFSSSMITLVMSFINFFILKGYMITFVPLVYGTMLVFLSLQNPDMYVDTVTGLMNKDGFIEISNELFKLGDKLEVIAVELTNHDSIKQLYGDNIDREIRKSIAKSVTEIFGANYVYYMSESRIVAILSIEENTMGGRNQKLGRGRAALKNIDYQKSGMKMGRENIKIDYNGCIVKCPDYANSTEKLLGVMDFVIEEMSEYCKLGEVKEVDDLMLAAFSKENKYREGILKATAKDDLYAFFQPIMDLHTGNIESAEIIPCIYDMDLGWLPSKDIVQLSEIDGDIVEMGMQLFNKTCKMIERIKWDDLKLRKIHINVSPYQCIQTDIADIIGRLIDKYHIDGSRLCVELVEPENNYLEANIGVVIEELVRRGVAIALDEYGDGYSNIARLSKSSVHSVKISESVVDSYFNGRSELLPYLINMLRQLNYTIYAMGVDTDEQLKQLKKMGCDYAQGYAVGEPVNIYEFMRDIKQNNK